MCLYGAAEISEHITDLGDCTCQCFCDGFSAQSPTRSRFCLIHAATDYTVEVISGEEEAVRAMQAQCKLHLTSGAFLDIGGAVPEVVT